MTRWEYFIKRVMLTIPVLFMVLTFLFIMLRMGPSIRSRPGSVRKRTAPTPN